MRLSFASPEVTRAVLSSPGVASYMMESVQLSVLLSEPDVRDSMVAFVAGMCSRSYQPFNQIAVAHCLSGIATLRYLTQCAFDSKQAYVMMVVMYFLGLVEVSPYTLNNFTSC